MYYSKEGYVLVPISSVLQSLSNSSSFLIFLPETSKLNLEFQSITSTGYKNSESRRVGGNYACSHKRTDTLESLVNMYAEDQNFW